MPRFRIGELVELNGVLAKLHGAAIETVVSVVPQRWHQRPGRIEFEDSRQLRLWSFQLRPVGIDVRRVAIDQLESGTAAVRLRSQLSSRLQSILAIKEELMREEFERKFQEMTLEVRRERHRYKNATEEMKNKSLIAFVKLGNVDKGNIGLKGGLQTRLRLAIGIAVPLVNE